MAAIRVGAQFGWAFPRALGTLAALLALASCGGGGGSSSPPPPQPTLALSASQLTFTAASSSASVATQSVTGTVTGLSSGTLYVLIKSTGPAVQAVSLPVMSGSSATSIVTPATPSTLGPGTYTSQITVTACLNDATCQTGQLAGSPATVNVTYQIDGLTIAPAAANLTLVEGSTASPVNVQVNRLFGTQSWNSVTTYAGGTPSGSVTVSPSSGTSIPATLAFGVTSGSGLAPGSYGATTTVTSGDGLSIPIPVNVTVQPKIQLSAGLTSLVNPTTGLASITAAMGQSTLPAPSVVSITANGSETGYTSTLTYLYGTTGWLNVTASGTLPGTITIQPNTTSLPVTGNATIYYAQVTLTPNSGGTPTVIYVNYWVYADTLSASPYTADFSFVAGSGAGAPSIPVNFQSNLGSASWNATVTYDSGPSNGWLVVPASGTTGVASSLTLNNPASLATGFYRAHVNLTAGTAVLTFPVSLSVHAAGVNYASPYGATAGVSGNAIIRGFGFTGATQVQFGSTNASAFTVVNDTEIDATYPATLAAGTYAVQVGTLPTRASLTLVGAPGFAAAALQHPIGSSGPVAALVYDAARRAIYLARNQTDGSSLLEVFTYSAGSWTSQTSGLISAAGTTQGLAMTPDGASLIALTRTGLQIFPLPAPLSAPTGVVFPNLPGIGTLQGGSAAMTNDGGLVVLGSASLPFPTVVFRYDALLQSLNVLDAPSGVTGYLQGSSVSPANENLVLFSSVSPPIPSVRYNASDSSFTTTPASVYATLGMTMSRDGSRLAASYAGYVEVFDFTTGTSLGYVTNATSMGAISPDGTKLYTYTTGFPNGLVHAFDLSKVSNGIFQEIGAGTNAAIGFGNLGQLLVTPDGGSLIITGDQQVAVMPAP